MQALARPRVAVSALSHDLPLRPPRPRSDREHLVAAVEWLCRCQDVSEGGGAAVTYNLVLGWGDDYPETTGYIAPTLFAYAEAFDEPEVAARAVENLLSGPEACLEEDAGPVHTPPSAAELGAYLLKRYA